MTEQRAIYLNKKKREKIALKLAQIGLLVLFICGWEVLAQRGIIDAFIMSSPSRIVSTMANFQTNGLIHHAGVTFLETVIGFTLGVMIGLVVSYLLWASRFLSKMMAPYLVVFHALPKIALGPIIIIWVGAGMQAVITMALAISVVVTIMEMVAGFEATDTDLLKLASTLGASKWQLFSKIVFPSNLHTFFNALKINIGLSLVGVIAGEFLVSRAGLGFLIIYGGQVFQMDLVMTSVVVLAFMAVLFHLLIIMFDALVTKYFHQPKK